MKKGFTLIELLAVIVILAIIALIATPIILNIINDAREKANERSVELYANAAKNAIAKHQLNNTSSPTSFDQLEIEYDGDVVCATKELYEDGSFYLDGCTVNGSEKTYSYGSKEKQSICTSVDVAEEGKYTVGDKYECKVDPNKDAYTFYVLTIPLSGSDSVNLIMDSNIRTGGEAVKESEPTEEQKAWVKWITNEKFLELGGVVTEEMANSEACKYGNICADNTFGPITAMDYLVEATKDWTNANVQTVSTFDDDAGGIHNLAKTYTTYARLPYYSEIVSTGCLNEEKSCPWLSDFLNLSLNYSAPLTLNGYWLLSSGTNASYYACYVNLDQNVRLEGVSGSISNGVRGVRPVITISTSDIQ